MKNEEKFVGKKGPYYMTVSSETMQGEEFELSSKPLVAGQ